VVYIETQTTRTVSVSNFGSVAREHLLSYRNGENKSTFAQRLIKNTHNMGKMEEIMKALYQKKKNRPVATMDIQGGSNMTGTN
jgi:hypothetical protein